MKTKTNQQSLLALIALTSLALVAGIHPTRADTVTINLDSVNAESNPLGVDATALLASYGITLTNVTDPGMVNIYSDNVVTYLAASPPPNFLMQVGAYGPSGLTYTLNFSTPLTSFSFTRIAQKAPDLGAQWTATAYSGATQLGSVGEPFGDIPYPAATYTLTDADITSVTFSSNGYEVAGIPSPPIDNLVLQTVPDSSSTWAMLTASAGLLIALRRRVKA